jgi:hypothetical protein
MTSVYRLTQHIRFSGLFASDLSLCLKFASAGFFVKCQG